jgi:[NiFe] hydrogenase diaphorase moiety large subunit
MLVTEQERLREDIIALARKHGKSRSALIPILQEIQHVYRHVSEFAMQVVADALDIHPVEVHSVVSFYSFLGTEPKGRFVIRLCQTVSCDLAGKAAVARQLENDLGIKFGETTKDGNFTLEYANCIGLCDQGPALLVNDEAHTKVTPEMVHEILEGCRRTFSVFALAKQEEHHA